MTHFTERTRRMIEEQVQRESRSIGTYSRYSSQAGNPALSSMLNELVAEKAGNRDAIRGLLGTPDSGSNAFEEQVYGHQIGGANPGGYRAGGTAGTEPMGRRGKSKPAGDNVGFEAAQLEFGWYTPVREPDQPSSGQPRSPGAPLNTHGNNYGMTVNPPAGSIQATDLARGEQTSGGYMTNAFNRPEDAPVVPSASGEAQSGPADEYIPWVTSDDDAILRDVLLTEREIDAAYSAIGEQLLAQPGHPYELEAANTVRRIREDRRIRIERLLAATRGR